ncbi:MAG TPA: hypothetical protein VJN50_01725 [Actinomycetota bacterium]|nr:hypothetical protein [Actinomycetota bacterium]
MRRLSVALLAVLVVGLVAGPAAAGNKGTVKIEEVPIDLLPDNSPHPGCDFLIEFFHYPEGSEVSWVFTVHPPTSDTNGPGSVVGSDSATLDPEDANNHHLNLSRVQNIEAGLIASGVEAHPQQGFHVKLSVTGPEGPKYKVFWVECAGYPPRAAPDTSGTSAVTPTDDSAARITWGMLGAFLAAGVVLRSILRRRLALRRTGG